MNYTRAPLAAVLVYLACAALLGFQKPGLHNDEAVFFDPAVHMLHSAQEPSFAHDPWSWVTILGWRWPLMVLPYAGAVRSYLAMIPFAVFGANYYTTRIVTTLVGAFALWGLSILVREMVDAQAAALVSLILAIHPSYLALNIYNQGVAEWMAPLGALSITLSRFLRTRTTSSAFWFGFAMGFGVWCRANIVWLLGSALLAGVIVLGKRMFVPLRQLAALTAGGVIGGAPLLWYEIQSRGATFAFMRSINNPQPLLHLIADRLNSLSQMLVASGAQRYIWSGPALVALPVWQPVVFSAVVAFALCLCLWNDHLAFGRVAALTFLLLLACMLVSRLNVSDQHLIALVPMVAVLVALAAQDSCRRWRSAHYVAVAVGILYLGSALYWNMTTARRIRSTGGVNEWSTSVDSLCGYLQQHYKERRIKALDWGFQHSLFVLSNGEISTDDLFPAATVERSGSGKMWQEEISPGDVYLVHSDGVIEFPAAGEGFSRALAAAAPPTLRIPFYQTNGAPFAAVLEILTTPVNGQR
jgi:Dolichyl-phosphate-mannose-protein mannosyltransferase